MKIIYKIYRYFQNMIGKYRQLTTGTIEYWNQRAKEHGYRSVLNLGHSYDEIEKVTEQQREVLFPILKEILKATDRLILDFGCGTGRFTKSLADLIHGRAVGIDPIEELIKLAPHNSNVEYKKLPLNGVIPLDSESIDVVWICLVLGGITNEKKLLKTICEISRVLKDDGRLILVENTCEKSSSKYWKFRSIHEYQLLFVDFKLRHLTDYYDMGERISVFIGHK
jgi:SAM-dependent methyltransferase